MNNVIKTQGINNIKNKQKNKLIPEIGNVKIKKQIIVTNNVTKIGIIEINIVFIIL